MALKKFFNKGAIVHNHAVNGRSSKSFLSEGRWKSVCDSLKPGEYINRPNGAQDSTHLNSDGARQVAGLFVDGVKELKLPLSVFIKNQ